MEILVVPGTNWLIFKGLQPEAAEVRSLPSGGGGDNENSPSGNSGDEADDNIYDEYDMAVEQVHQIWNIKKD